MGDRFTELSCEEFAERLAARESVPGGGGAAALVGALGAALCSMAGAFARSRSGASGDDAELEWIMGEAEDVRYRLLELVEEDADGFAPVLEAYRMPKDDPDRAKAIERATEGACMAPLAMMGECCRAIVLLEKMGRRCSQQLISDVACGVLLVRAALECASVNVYVNTSALRDRYTAERIEGSVSELLDEYVPRAERLALSITDRIGGSATNG